MYTEERIRIAMQKKGRLAEASMQFLASKGLSFPPNGRSLMLRSENFDVDVLFLRDDDIPEYLNRGVVDYGIVGENVLSEKGFGLPVLGKLGFGSCKLMIAAPVDSRIKEPGELRGKRIATSYPRLLGEFLRKAGVGASIVPISGSAEITPELDLADAICDIVQTGATLKAHDLIPICTLMESQAVLVARPGSPFPLPFSLQEEIPQSGNIAI